MTESAMINEAVVVLILTLFTISCTKQELISENIHEPSKKHPDQYALVGPGECFYIDWPSKGRTLCMTEGEIFVPGKLKQMGNKND